MGTKASKVPALVEKKKVDKLEKLILKREKDKEAAVAAIIGLGTIGGETACEILQVYIRDNDPDIRRATAMAFQKSGNDHITEMLRHQMLVEKDPEIKKEFEKAMDFSREQRA